MVTKQTIQKKLETLTEEQLNQVYEVIEKLSNSEEPVRENSLMSKMRKISIDAPEDFSTEVAINLGRDVSEE